MNKKAVIVGAGAVALGVGIGALILHSKKSETNVKSLAVESWTMFEDEKGNVFLSVMDSTGEELIVEVKKDFKIFVTDKKSEVIFNKALNKHIVRFNRSSVATLLEDVNKYVPLSEFPNLIQEVKETDEEVVEEEKEKGFLDMLLDTGDKTSKPVSKTDTIKKLVDTVVVVETLLSTFRKTKK